MEVLQPLPQTLLYLMSAGYGLLALFLIVSAFSRAKRQGNSAPYESSEKKRCGNQETIRHSGRVAKK